MSQLAVSVGGVSWRCQLAVCVTRSDVTLSRVVPSNFYIFFISSST